MRTKESHLFQLYALPASARRDTSGWSDRHREAVVCPKDPFERALFGMLRGWLVYADAHRHIYESGIGDDGVRGGSGACWAQICVGLRDSLNGELAWLDGGTLEEAGFDPGPIVTFLLRESVS